MIRARSLTLAAAAVLAAVFCPARASAEEDGTEAAMAIADRYGIVGFGDIQELRFTFNVKRGTTTFARAWTWSPVDGTVSVDTMEAGKKFTHSYNQKQLEAGDRALNEKTDRWFVNDTYWLLFPLHLAWDRGLDLTLDEDEALPIAPGRANRLVADYTDMGGYTPGDVYEVYFGDDRLVKQWVFRRGGSPTPTVATTWEENAQLGPVILSMKHRSGDGSLVIWFSDVQARMKNSTAWISPRPL
ncbi:MAG: hypothetical protein JO102_03890 [Elusimicrobia bacterium]|nr:hypothetical protein [Elusimicrobiota bacterium]